METTFDFILPSNVAPDTYPNNNASDYITPLINPLQLDKQWLVGLKSIFYDSHIGDENEKAVIKVLYDNPITVFYNDLIRVPYKTVNNKWDYSKHSLNISTPITVKKLCHALTEVSQRLKKTNAYYNIFKCEAYRNEIKFHPSSYSLSIRLSNALAKLLESEENRFISLNDLKFNFSKLKLSNTLVNKDDFNIRIFDWRVIHQEAEIILKKRGEDLLARDELIKRWNKQVRPYIQCKLYFSDQGKCIIYLLDEKSAIIMDKNMASTVSHPHCIFGSSEYWGWYLYGEKQDNPKEHEWSIKIYKNRLRKGYEYRHSEFDYEVYPRRHSVTSILEELSKGLSKRLRENIKFKVEIKFSLEDNYTKIELPHGSFIEMTSNLAKMLGFDQTKFETGNHISRILPATLDQREQEIFVYTDLCDPLSYGNQQRQIFQNFVHNKDKDYGIVEKWFEPIHYQPLMKQNIDLITIKLLDRTGQPLPIMNGKTVVTLQFRRN